MNIKVTKDNFINLDRATQQEYTARKLAEGYGVWFTQMHENMQKDNVENTVFNIENMIRYSDLDTAKELTNSLKSDMGNYKLSRVTALNIIEDLKL